jgi:hypothetical protein
MATEEPLRKLVISLSKQIMIRDKRIKEIQSQLLNSEFENAKKSNSEQIQAFKRTIF